MSGDAKMGVQEHIKLILRGPNGKIKQIVDTRNTSILEKILFWTIFLILIIPVGVYRTMQYLYGKIRIKTPKTTLG